MPFFRLFISGLLFFFAYPSLASKGLSCRQIFHSPKPFTQTIETLEFEAFKAKNFAIQEALKSRNLPEALRIANEKGLVNLSYQINNLLRDILLNDTLKKEIELDAAGSEAFLVEFTSGVRAIFKPEVDFWENPEKIKFGKYLSNSSAEVSAYQLSVIWGLDLVPMTLMRTLNGKKGSLQAFVRKGAEPQEESISYLRNLHNLIIFDFLIQNADRYYTYNADFVDVLNIIFSGNRIWAIDHGASFQPNSKKRTTSSEFQNLDLRFLSLSFIQNLRATTPNILRELLKSYPNQEIVEEIIARRNQLIEKLPPGPSSRH